MAFTDAGDMPLTVEVTFYNFEVEDFHTYYVGTESVPFRWATDAEVANQMWKMTTKTNGTSIKLKLGNGQSMTIQ